MQHPYKIEAVKPRHSLLLENGIVIAKVYRRASPSHITLSFYDVKWNSTAAKGRFDDFSDSLSIGETLEALGA